MPKTEYFITKEVYLAEPYPAFLLVLCRYVRPTWLVIRAKQVTGQKMYPTGTWPTGGCAFRIHCGGLGRLDGLAGKALAAKVTT